MKYATRLNSFLRVDKDLKHALEAIGKIDGVDFVDMNYPEHLADYSVPEVKQMLADNNLRCNAINLRFRDKFLHGEFGNIDRQIAEDAITLCKEATEVCEQLDGSQVIIWLGFDGFDYSFQIDYNEYWDRIIYAFKTIAAYSKKPVSIEYKPYEERVHAFIDSFGTTMTILNEVDSDNLGATLDFCHMLMKKENPALATAYLAKRGKLFNLHLNDGEGSTDDGLMVGTVNLWKTIEVMYYLKKYNFKGAVYFDTFPKREGAVAECEANIKMCRLIETMIDNYGIENIDKVVLKQDGAAAANLMVELIAAANA